MKIVILHGSPKGKESNTIHYVKFIQKKNPQHEYILHNVAKKIKQIEKNENLFKEIIKDVNSSDAIIWSFPVYTCFVPAQYIRFIELINERNVATVFKNKYTIAISTSIHFYDHTAHRYINAVCDDLGMNFVGFHSAKMEDLLENDKRDKLLKFAENLFAAVKNKTHCFKTFHPIKPKEFNFIPKAPEKTIDSENKKIVVITDNDQENSNIGKMIQRFVSSFKKSPEIINLNKINIKGGCIGCIQCGYDNKCAYKDDFMSFYNSNIISSDIIIFAFELKNRIFSSKWKEYFDRRFFYNHVPDMKGKQLGVLISGVPSSYIHDFIDGFFEIQQSNIAGTITDENSNSEVLNNDIHQLAKNLISFSKVDYIKSDTFLGVGSKKIFRDDIYGSLRFVFQADHRYYKKNRIYDFPQKQYKKRVFTLVMMLLTKNSVIRKKFYNNINKLMTKPLEKIVDKY